MNLLPVACLELITPPHHRRDFCGIDRPAPQRGGCSSVPSPVLGESEGFGASFRPERLSRRALSRAVRAVRAMSEESRQSIKMAKDLI